MSTDARESLRLLVAALEEHLEAVASRRGATDAAVDDAYEKVAEAFEQYEEALDVDFAEALPLMLDDDDADDDDDPGDFDNELDAHAAEDEDDMDDDIEEFDLR